MAVDLNADKDEVVTAVDGGLFYTGIHWPKIAPEYQQASITAGKKVVCHNMGLVFFALAVMTMHTELSLLVKEDTLVDL